MKKTTNTHFRISILSLALLTVLTTACSGFATRDTGNADLEAAAPSDSPAVVAQRTGGVAPSFPTIDASRWSGLDTSQTGVIFAWTISGSERLVSDSGCRLRVRHRESGDTVLLKIDTQNPVSIQKLKPGTWEAKRLGCGLTRIWDLEGLFREGFIVKPDSISVTGWFIFEFDDRTLVRVREGGRAENSNLAMQLRASWSGRSELISGFSGKPIPMKIEPSDEIVRVKAIGLKDSASLLQPLLDRFQACASATMKVDPLRAGTLRMTAIYKAGKFEGAKSVSQDHALRDDFLQCIRESQETFSLEGAGDFTLETTY